MIAGCFQVWICLCALGVSLVQERLRTQRRSFSTLRMLLEEQGTSNLDKKVGELACHCKARQESLRNR